MANQNDGIFSFWKNIIRPPREKYNIYELGKIKKF